MKLTDFLENVGRPVAYYPDLRLITGSTTATILLCQFIYWRGKESDPDGWLYKSIEDIEEETGLSKNEQKTARNKLKTAKLLEEYYARLDHQLWFRVDLDRINELWGKLKPNFPESYNPAFGKVTFPFSLNSNTENTQEITSSEIIKRIELKMNNDLSVRNAVYELCNELREKGYIITKKHETAIRDFFLEREKVGSSQNEEDAAQPTEKPAKKKGENVNADIKTIARSRGVPENEINFIDRTCKAFGFSIMQLDEVSLVTYRWIAEQESKGQTIEMFADWARTDEQGKFIGKYRNSAGNIRNDWARAFGIKPPDDRTSLIRRMT